MWKEANTACLCFFNKIRTHIDSLHVPCPFNAVMTYNKMIDAIRLSDQCILQDGKRLKLPLSLVASLESC